MVANHVLCQLSYTPDKHFEIRISKFRRGWLRGRDLNPRPLGYEPNELPDCSTPRKSNPLSKLLPRRPVPTTFDSAIAIAVHNPQSAIKNPKSLVGLGRFELPTSRLSGVRSNQLSYRPIFFSARIYAQKRATLLFSALPFYGGRARRAV